MKKVIFIRVVIPLLLLGWVLWTVAAAWITGPVISDSWQSVASAIAADYPLDLKGLFLGDFDGYNHTWGHHWPGWAMFLSFIFSWLPFHALVVFVLEVILLLGIGIFVYRIALDYVSQTHSAIAAFLVLLEPSFHVSISMMRPEAATAFLIIALLYLLLKHSITTWNLCALAILATLLPVFHVMGCVAPPAICLVLLRNKNLSYRNIFKFREIHPILVVLGGWFIGCLILAVWFYCDTTRWHHFTQNLEGQRMSLHSIYNSFVVCYFGDTGAILMLILWIFVALFLLRSLLLKDVNSSILFCALMPLAVVFFSAVAQNPNRIQLVSVWPCAILACLIGSQKCRLKSTYLNRTVVVLFSVLLLYAFAFHCKRLLRFVTQESDSLRVLSGKIIYDYQGDHKIFIPMTLWEAAAIHSNSECLFYTFPNVSSLQYRYQCERSTLSKAEFGDILILDDTQEQVSGSYFLDDALVRLRSVDVDTIGKTIETRCISGYSGKRCYRVIRIENPLVFITP